MKKLVFLLLIGCSAFGQEAKEEDYTTPVVRVVPLDMARVKQIEALLEVEPKGFGDPWQKREIWENLAKSGDYAKVLLSARQLAGKPFPPFDEATYMRMFTHGDSQAGKDELSGRLRWLVTLTWAECLENNGAYTSKIEEVIEGLINQKTWVNPRNYLERNHQNLVELSCASYAQNLAQVLYLLNDKLKPETHRQVHAAIRKRMFDPILATINGKNPDHGWLTSTNNWNAVCLSGIAGAALTILPDKRERAQFLAIAERYHQNFMVGFLSDGYCTEGISYYNYGFGRFISLREIVFQATQGKLDFFKNPKMARIAAFGINSEIINDTYPAIADCKTGSQPSANITWYASRNLGLNFPKYNQPKYGAAADLVADVLYAFPGTATQKTSVASTPEKLPVRSYFEVAGILTVRPAKLQPHSMGAVFKGGRNNEHHNHNDVGSYTVTVGKEIMTGDPGSIPYTAKTFGNERYTYKSLASYGHPVPLVAGVQQSAGKQARARVLNTRLTETEDKMEMDLTSAYEVAALKELKRNFQYSRGKSESLVISDNVVFDSPQSFETAIITKSKWEKVSEKEVWLTNKGEVLRILIDSGGNPFTIEPEEIAEAGGEPYTRLAVRLSEPVTSARVSLTYLPQTKP